MKTTSIQITAIAKIAMVSALILLAAGTVREAQAGSEPTQPDAALAPASDSVQESDGFFQWMDNSVSFLPYGWNYEVDPSEQMTFSFEHVHSSKIGDLFMFVDGTHFPNADGGDDWTWYGEVAPRLSLGKTLGQDFSWTPIRPSLFEVKDVLIAAQYERGEDADEAEAALVGLGLDLDVREAGFLGPLGKFSFIQLNAYARSELTETAETGFRDMQITMSAAYPIKIGDTRILLDGYFDYVIGIGSEDPSFHFNPQIKLDVGNYWGKPEELYLGVELDFWWNKYQIRDSDAFNTDQSAVSVLLKYHF